MIIAISGTPGTGKSTVARALEGRGMTCIDLNAEATERGLFCGYDEIRKVPEVDLDRLSRHIKEMHPPRISDPERVEGGPGSREIIFLEGHYSHLLVVDAVVVLRCHPVVLEKRLLEKGHRDDKLRENIEAEAMACITTEALESNREVFEVDTTSEDVDVTSNAILRIALCLKDGDRRTIEPYLPGHMDWSEVILSWY